MKKIIGIVLVLGILIGLIVFACLYDYEDSHLKKDGYRVRLEGKAVIVNDCDYKDITYCEKKININNEEALMKFELVDFKEDGYPSKVRASINDHVFYEDDLDIKNNGTKDYKVFLNFYVMNKELILFSLTNGSGNRTTSIYAIDIEGNIVLKVDELDEDMLIKDYVEFIEYKDNTFTLYGSKLEKNININGESVCNTNKDDIVEAYYLFTYKNGLFNKKTIKQIKAQDFIKDNEISC